MELTLNDTIINTTISKNFVHTPATATQEIYTKDIVVGTKIDVIDIENGVIPDYINVEDIADQTTISKTLTVTPNLKTNEVTTDVIFLNEDSKITFLDVDGTVVDEIAKSTGYQYVEIIPTSFSNGMVYDIGELSDNTNLYDVNFTASANFVQTCEVWFRTPSTVPTRYKWPKNTYWIDSPTGAAPTFIASKNYRIVFRQEPTKIIASIAYLY